LNAQNKRLVSKAIYRQTTKRLGWALVLFSALFFGLELTTEVLLDALPKNMTWDAESLVVGLVEGLSYLISFLIPTGLLLCLTPRERLSIKTLRLRATQRSEAT
jgi:hypothetical protein